MNEFKFYHPVEVRYSDLGTLQHVNNARYLNFLEEGRIAYRKHLELLEGVGVIIVDLHITYYKPVFLDDRIKVGTRVSSIGHKSLTFEHCIVNLDESSLFASAETVIVAYDYDKDEAIAVPGVWRERIAAYEKG